MSNKFIWNDVLGNNSQPKLKWHNVPNLVWIDNKTIEVERLIGNQNVKLLAQLDSNQCGPASVVNIMRVLNISSDFNSNIYGLRKKVPFELRGQTNREDDENFWFTVHSVEYCLELIVPNCKVASYVDIPNVGILDFNKINAFVVDVGRHYVAIIKVEGIFYKIDSLGENAPSVTLLSQQRLISELQHARTVTTFEKPKLIWRNI